LDQRERPTGEQHPGICKGPEGYYLWLATYDGLARFYGVRFVLFNKSNSDGILSDRFFRLVRGRDGAIRSF